MTIDSVHQEQAEDRRRKAGKAEYAAEASRFLTDFEIGRRRGLVAWRDEFYVHRDGGYRRIATPEVRDRIILYLNERFKRVSTGLTRNVLDQVRAQSRVPSDLQPPIWLSGVHNNELPVPSSVIAARNGLLDVAEYARGIRELTPSTPDFFTLTPLPYDIDLSAPPPGKWAEFLKQLWPEDQECIDALQELLGYLVVGGTWLQKIFAFIGPPRSGKGTIARVMRALIGLQNCCGPTLGSLGTNFGLWPFLGKSLATISDARLSGRTDQAVVVERLLSISGEDAITIDRKNLEPLTVTLPTRIVLLTNDPPGLRDDSGAMANRLILWQFTESFRNRENPNLTSELLTELPSILRWSLDGWVRLQNRGKMIQPRSGAAMLDDIQELGSTITAFVRERCELHPDLTVPVEVLYRDWGEWCKSQGHHCTPLNVFGRDLKSAYPQLAKTQRRESGGDRPRDYVGIAVRNR